jgi:hypothetical protein
MWYPLGVVYHLLGAALLVAVILWQRYQTRQEQKSHDRQVSG